MVSMFKSSLQPTWIYQNKLLQKYPRLFYLEQQHSQCSKSLNQLNQLLAYVIVTGLHRNPFVMSRVLYSCLSDSNQDGKLKRSYGSLIFSQTPNPNVFTWNTIIRAFAASDCSTDHVLALGYYKEMLHREAIPDEYTYPFLLQACRTGFDIRFGKQVHGHAVMRGHVTNLFVQNSFIHFYLLSAYVSQGRKMFDEMTVRDVVSWTTLISGLVTQGCYVEAVLVFNKMKLDESSIRPNAVTMLSLISACANLGSLDNTRGFHAYLEKVGWFEAEVSIRNSLIDAYSKCASLDCAIKVFHGMHSSQRDIYSWTAMIAGLAIHGHATEAVERFLQMKQVVGMVPDAITFIAVLSACAHGGLVNEGVEIFKSMNAEYGIVPEVQHYGCMVDLFGRAGLLEYSYELLEMMPIKPNLAIFGSLLSACRVQKNVELGELVLDKIKCSCDYSGGASVLMSNMYASEKNWNEVAHVRKGTREGTDYNMKPPGRSWIDVKGVLHEFVVGDKSHSAMALYNTLDGLAKLSTLN